MKRIGACCFLERGEYYHPRREGQHDRYVASCSDPHTIVMNIAQPSGTQAPLALGTEWHYRQALLEDPVVLRKGMNTRMTQLCRTNEAVLDSDFSADI